MPSEIIEMRCESTNVDDSKVEQSRPAEWIGTLASANSSSRHESNPTMLFSSPERMKMLKELERLLKEPIQTYVWAFRGIHPGALLFLSFVVSQVLHEIFLYEFFEAYQHHDLGRTAFEIISPLFLWLLVDTALQIGLTLCRRGQRILVQLKSGELLVFHRKLLSPRPDRVECRIVASLALSIHQMGYAVDRIDTPVGRFYVWGRWRDVRLLLRLEEVKCIDASIGPKFYQS